MPLQRSGPKGTNQFEKIGVDEAWLQIAAKARDIVKNHGSKAILGAFYSGNTGLLAGSYPLRFFAKLGGTVTGGGICNEGGIEGLNQLFGTYSTTNPFQLQNIKTRLIVIWGSDLFSHNIHAAKMVDKAREHGAKLAVIDTRRTNLASSADLFIHATPGTEGLIALLVLKRLVGEKQLDNAFLDRHVGKTDEVIDLVRGLDEITLLSGIDVNKAEIDALVRLLIEHRGNTIFNIGFGVQKYVAGGEAVKAIALVQVFLGNLGKPGCGVVYSQSGVQREILTAFNRHIIAKKMLGIAEEIPLIDLAEKLETGKYKMLVIYNFNPASSLPDQTRLRAQLARNDLFVVVHDLYTNATTRYADIVYPAKAGVETNDLIWGFYVPGISINQAGPCPYPACMSNVEFFQRFAMELGLDEGVDHDLFHESDGEIVQQCLLLAGAAMTRNINGSGYHLFVDNNTILYQDLKFPTPGGKIQAIPPRFSIDHMLRKGNNEFFLITPMHDRFIHSQLGELNPTAAADFDKVFMNPGDMAALNVKEGDRVNIIQVNTKLRYIVQANVNLKQGTAMLYSGGPSSGDGMKNANFFTPSGPESLGHSGSYNSGIIKVQRFIEQESNDIEKNRK